jgi:hypothetical protein
LQRREQGAGGLPAEPRLGAGGEQAGRAALAPLLVIRDVTACPPLALLLFGGRFVVGRDRQAKDGLVALRVGGWVRVRAKPKVAHLLALVRRLLDGVLAQRFLGVVPERAEDVFEAVARLVRVGDEAAASLDGDGAVGEAA